MRNIGTLRRMLNYEHEKEFFIAKIYHIGYRIYIFCMGNHFFYKIGKVEVRVPNIMKAKMMMQHNFEAKWSKFLPKMD